MFDLSSAPAPVSDSELCDLCKYVVNYLDTFLDKNGTAVSYKKIIFFTEHAVIDYVFRGYAIDHHRYL